MSLASTNTQSATTHLSPEDTELKIRGIQILILALGVTGALRFLSLLRREPTDYVKISRLLYANQSLDEIFRRAQTRAEAR